MSRLGMNFNAMAERLQKREARLAELDQLKSEFVSTVSHELRTPLTTIKALTRLLMREGLEETKRREYIETISVECDRQIDFVLNLLDLSRIEGGVLRVTHERVEVDEVISSVVKSEARSAEKGDTNFESNPSPRFRRCALTRKSFVGSFRTSSRTLLSTHQTADALFYPLVKKTRM